MQARREGFDLLLIAIHDNISMSDIQVVKTILYTATAMTALRRHANKAKLIRTKIEQHAASPASQAHNAEG